MRISDWSSDVCSSDLFEVLFAIHSLSSGASEDEVELGEEDCDVLPMDGDSVDIGELAAETVSLALDPYPRLPDAALAEYRRLLTSEEEAQAAADAEKKANNPFAVLKKGRSEEHTSEEGREE